MYPLAGDFLSEDPQNLLAERLNARTARSPCRDPAVGAAAWISSAVFRRGRAIGAATAGFRRHGHYLQEYRGEAVRHPLTIPTLRVVSGVRHRREDSSGG